MTSNLFDLNEEKSFENAKKLKEELVSEIDFIRETMIVVNMFLTESFKTGATLFQELQKDNLDNSHEQTAKH